MGEDRPPWGTRTGSHDSGCLDLESVAEAHLENLARLAAIEQQNVRAAHTEHIAAVEEGDASECLREWNATTVTQHRAFATLSGRRRRRYRIPAEWRCPAP